MLNYIYLMDKGNIFITLLFSTQLSVINLLLNTAESMNSEIILQVILFFFIAFSNAQNSPKIIGGFNVSSIEGFEYQVSLRDASYESSKFGSGHICGGSLIDYNKVLTASHCVHNGRKFLAAHYFVAVMGNLDLFDRNVNTVVRRIKKIIGHPNYNADTFENDIAVLILNDLIPVNHPTAKPIPLSNFEARAGQNCTTAGWGTIEYDENASAVRWLMAVNLNVNLRAACNKPSSHAGSVQKGMFCAGPFEGGKDTCQGDSGGGFVCKGVLVGVTSHGFECGLPNYPGIYMDVSYYRKWIETEGRSSSNDAGSVWSNVKNYLYSMSVAVTMFIK
ncbi:hypothetical protein PVAND_002834 [Polypedilum vanderplanki]|uniref:Peptidase S1 domain-containing protein n=1 Tax=Polypedilum vanderplanki TaxID=319348 RepID=A0A9J6BT08_POLVA|nr:hypothetical protein PVAND_002834 [Polypedilum vanderplanki]